MGRITATIPDELEKQLKHKVVEKYGGKHGDTGKAIEEAISEWVNNE